MDCPFCGKKMRAGGFPSHQGELEWITNGREGAESGLEARVRLTPRAWFFSQEADAFYCPDCRQVIIPVPKIEPVTKKLRNTLDTMAVKAGQLREDWETNQAENKEEKKWKKRKGKDPWEW